MINTEKVINVVDAVCDCIPIVSTFTNGAQLLYKLACKVDANANPVNATWRDDVKIHVMNKSNRDCLIGLVPVIGNLMNFVNFILFGLRDQLMYSVIESKTELVKLHLERHPLIDNPNAKKVLAQSAASSSIEVFNLILESRNWDMDSIVFAVSELVLPEENANLLLNYFDKDFKNSEIPETEACKLIHISEKYISSEKVATASRILNMLPQCEFSSFQEILSKCSLTKDQVNGILDRCKPFKLEMLTEYCKKVSAALKTLEKEVDSKSNGIAQCNECISNLKIKNPSEDLSHLDKYIRVKLDKQELINGFYEIHAEIIEKLLNLVNETKNASDLVDLLSSLVNEGSVPLLKKVLEKYENQLSVDDKLNVLKKIKIRLYEYDALDGLAYFFRRYHLDFTDHQCSTLIESFPNDREISEPFIKKMIEIRPSLDKKSI